MFRRITSLTLAFALLLCILPFEVLALDTIRKTRESSTQEAEEIIVTAETAAPAEESAVSAETEAESVEETVEEVITQEPAGAVTDSGTCGDNLT